MKDLINKIRRLFCVKVADNPSPDLERKIEEGRTRLNEQVSLLRLSNSELIRASRDLRFGVMQDLINDIARSK